MTAPSSTEFGFPVPKHQFNQKNEMFKRSRWDETVRHYGERFYKDIVYRDNPGRRKLDFAFRAGSWNLEWTHAEGNARSNSGIYTWNSESPKLMHFANVDGAVKESPAKMSRAVKTAARFYGADLVGICEVHPNWIYSHEFNTNTLECYPLEYPEECRFAVVLAVEMDYEAMRSAKMIIQGAATGLGYSKMAFVAGQVAAFIRALGYQALPSGNDTGLSVPLAMAAGLGEAGRMGLLITEKFGPRVRLCKVFTDLPLEPDRYRPFGVTKFCETCKLCAEDCPSGAVPKGEQTSEGHNVSNLSGIHKWHVDAERCFSFWAKSRADCSTCIRVCPFNKPPGWIHRAARFFVSKAPVLNPLLLHMDRLAGYGKPYSIRRFWNEDE